MIDLSWTHLGRSALHRGWRIDGCGGDFRWRLGWQFELERVEQHAQLGLRLGVAGEQEFASIGCRDVDVDHLDGGELLEHAARGQPRRQRIQAAFERDMQAIGEEGDEDMRLDPLLLLVEDRADGEIAFEGLERLLHPNELQIVGP